MGYSDSLKMGVCAINRYGCLRGPHNTNSLNKELITMNTLARYHAANLPELFEKISRNSIGMDDYLNRFWDDVGTTSNYPPYNVIQVNNVESRLEIALAGFKKKEVKVYTEFGKLFVEGKKKNQRLLEKLSIKDLPNAHSNEHGRSPMIVRYDPSSLKMDFLV